MMHNEYWKKQSQCRLNLSKEVNMATVKLLNYEDASPEARQVLDEIKAVRGVDDVNNFWKALAHQPETLRRVWAGLKDVMADGEIDSLTKEMIYVAVSVTNNCDYCIHSHTASAFSKGMTEGQYSELMAVVAMAHQTNALATGLKVPVDKAFDVE